MSTATLVPTSASDALARLDDLLSLANVRWKLADPDESKGYTAKIRVDAFEAIWARYDSGDYGVGKAGLGVYDDIEGLPKVMVVDEDVLANPDRSPSSTLGPQRIQLATTR